MDVQGFLQGAAALVVVGGAVISVSVWAWRRVSKIVADQRREREQTSAMLAKLDKRVEWLNVAWQQQAMHHVQEEAEAAVKAKEQGESFDALRAQVNDLEQSVLKLQAKQVRKEDEQRQLIETLRADLARLSERFEKVASQFVPRP